MWVHYFDPHYPYAPPEPFRSLHADRPYLGEVAAMDHALGQLVQAFEARAGSASAIVVVGDHGEGLSEHGEAQHGKLVYQATMRVPLVLVGPGVAPGVVDAPVSARRVFHTLVDWAGLEAASSLRAPGDEIVLGEAMKPFLAYGWQPQVMAIEGSLKLIRAGRSEAYDLASDPGETRDVAATAAPSRPLRDALREYPVPSLAAAAAPPAISDEQARKLASLGYVSAGVAPVVRADAPRPADMSGIFDALDEASTLFVREDYRRAIPLLRRILAEDRHNLDAALRLATAHSALGQGALAEQAFDTAAEIAPGSPDVRLYRALHYAKGREWPRAVPLLEQALAESPDRLPALEALARLRERQGRDPRGARALAARLRTASRGAGRARPRGRARDERRPDRVRDPGLRAGARGRRDRFRARPRARSAVPRGPALHRGAGRARPRPGVTPGLRDGALQAGAGERAAERTRSGPAHRAGPPTGGRDDARVDREGTVVQGAAGRAPKNLTRAAICRRRGS